MDGKQTAGISPPQRFLVGVGIALLFALFGWLMMVDEWTTGWPPTSTEEVGGSVTWRQSVKRLPRDVLLIALLCVLYLHSREWRQNWSMMRERGVSGKTKSLAHLPKRVRYREPRAACGTTVQLYTNEPAWRVVLDALGIWATEALTPILCRLSNFTLSSLRLLNGPSDVARAPSGLRQRSKLGPPVPRSTASGKGDEEELVRRQGGEDNFADLTESDLRCISHLSVGTDCVLALQAHNANHTQRMKNAVPNIFLLQFGALMGENSALEALKALRRVGELGSPCGLFGQIEGSGSWDDRWSKPIVKSKPGLTLETCKRPWRRGLFLYKTTTIIEDASPADFRAFNMDMAYRKQWDWSMVEWQRLKDNLNEDPCADSTFYFHEARMPGPMSNRLYVCARRVWSQPDGGCYWITTSADHPNVQGTKGGRVHVDCYTSGSILRATKSRQGLPTPAVELASLYYDDPKMKPIAYNLAMKNAFWVAMQATEKAFRQWSENKDGVDQMAKVNGFKLQTEDDIMKNIVDTTTVKKTCKKGWLPGVLKALVVSGVMLIVQKKISK